MSLWYTVVHETDAIVGVSAVVESGTKRVERVSIAAESRQFELVRLSIAAT